MSINLIISKRVRNGNPYRLFSPSSAKAHCNKWGRDDLRRTFSLTFFIFPEIKRIPIPFCWNHFFPHEISNLLRRKFVEKCIHYYSRRKLQKAMGIRSAEIGNNNIYVECLRHKARSPEFNERCRHIFFFSRNEFLLLSNGSRHLAILSSFISLNVFTVVNSTWFGSRENGAGQINKIRIIGDGQRFTRIRHPH